MIILVLIVLILFLIYKYGTKDYNYWKERGVVYEKPLPFIGNMADMMVHGKSIGEFYADLYRKHPNEKIIGMYSKTTPTLIVRDPEIIKHILITDFNNFFRRGMNHSTKLDEVEPMMRNLFLLDGDTWKLLRQRMTPSFTSGKLKAMFPIIVKNAENLYKKLENASKQGKEVEMRDLIARYTTDFIGAVAFGINTDSLENEDSHFRKLGKTIFDLPKSKKIIAFLRSIIPGLMKSFHIFPTEVAESIISLMNDIMEKRNFKPSGNNDFIDMLMEMRAKGVIRGESMEVKNPDGTPKMVELEWDNILMAAQVFVFFAAGFETSSSSTSFTLHLLAYHPEAQTKCQEEIDEVLSRYGGKLCYEAVKEMKYLEMCFKESVRIYPSLTMLNRNCENQYKIPGTNVVIDKGVVMIIPVLGIHHDEKYYPDPETFKPERFHPDNINDLEKCVHLPFGEGPRACIGERLGLMQSLSGLAVILSKYSVAPSKNSTRHPEISSNFLLTPKGGIPLELIARKKTQ